MINLVTRMQRALVALLPLLVIACLPAATACSACPPRGPRAVRIDPAFSEAQRGAIEAAVYEWDDDARLTVVISSWDDTDAVPIIRDDSITAQCRLGVTHFETAHKDRRDIRLAGTGALGCNYGTVEDYDFETTILHELGHLYGLSDGGCDGAGHSNDVADVMYVHGQHGVRKTPTANDIQRVDAVVDGAW
jgi:hypothetical protein